MYRILARVIPVLLPLLCPPAPGSPWIMSSQVGYDLGDPIDVFMRGQTKHCLPDKATCALSDATDRLVMKVDPQYWGQQWGSHWWIAEFSALERPGRYSVCIKHGSQILATSDPIEVGRDILWDKSFPVIAFDYLKTRSQQARTGKGWKDCGSDLQEFSSHAMCVDGICDVLEIAGQGITAEGKVFLRNQLIRGCGYLAHLQDKAKSQGLGDGAVIHEDRDRDVVTGNIAKAAAVFARVARLVAQHHPTQRAEYLERARCSFTWIEQHGPVMPPGSQAFFAAVHGAPAGSVPPKGQWMTRDLLTMTRAAIELFLSGKNAYQAKAISYAKRVMARQLSREQAEGGLWGHFYTYDDFSSFGGIKFTEKANIHCGAWSKDGRIYNKGGHYPHHLLPLMDMLKLWPAHPDAARWKQCLHDFAYGYFIPACEKSPFLILPAGYYRDQGLMYFGSWYHGHNNIYAFTASLALELGRLFDDPRLCDIAVGNIQWIAGLNCGKAEGKPAQYRPVSMIYGIGNRYRGSWSKIPGSVCNGFSASRQFRIAPITADRDKPVHFDDEAYIAHSLPFLAALARLEFYRD